VSGARRCKAIFDSVSRLELPQENTARADEIGVGSVIASIADPGWIASTPSDDSRLAMNEALAQGSVVAAPAAQQDAFAHRAMRRLLRTALHRAAEARARMQAGDLRSAGIAIGKAIHLVGGLRDVLDFDAPDRGEDFEALCTYVEQRLVQANREADVVALDEVRLTLGPIADAWDQASARHMAGATGAAELIGRSTLRKAGGSR
jgi:flagellar protein FliS